MSEFEADDTIRTGDFSGAVLNVEMAEAEARLFVVHILQAGGFLENGLVQFGIGVWNGAACDADPAAIFLFGDADDFHIRIDENLTVGVLLFPNMEVYAVVMLQENADRADTRLVFIYGREEKWAGIGEEVGDFVDGIDLLQVLNFEFTSAGGA